MGKPVLLTVDDDPGVSRSVARDLRRRYGEEFRILRADSAMDALDALRELKLRGDVVAAMLADYRMPQMNGIEFLEQAMDLFPRARRALLTAYADTDAAIQAINLVDVDHYLLKPWDPPEEKLYPVVDALIETWRATGDSAVEETKVIGHRWSAPSFQARDFLARNAVPYRYFSVDDPEGLRLLEAAGACADDVPVVITPDGVTMCKPTDTEIAGAVGLSTQPAAEFYDLVVVGAGPAGLGAAVYGASDGLRTEAIERIAVGGQAGTSSRIENYLGFPAGISGSDLAERAFLQANKFGARVSVSAEATRLEADGGQLQIVFADDTVAVGRSAVLATGARYRRLAVPGIEGFHGNGVYYAATYQEALLCGDGPVVIVGAGNSAGQATVFLATHVSRVYLLARGDGLGKSMSRYLVDQIVRQPRVTVLLDTEIREVHGDDALKSVVVENNRTGERQSIKARALFVFIGADPNTEWLAGTVALDDHGFIETGHAAANHIAGVDGLTTVRHPAFLETSVLGVFAAGDVRSGSVKRVASAVGEGAMVIRQVNNYLMT
jgi:thioredoxin reductase (NADPH)